MKIFFGKFLSKKDSKENVLDSLHIENNLNDSIGFPVKFVLKANNSGQLFEINLTKKNTEFRYPDVFFIDKSGILKKYNFKKSEVK